MDDFCWGLEKQSSTLGEMRIASMATTSTFSISPLFGFGDGNVYVWSIRSGKEVVVLDFSKVNIIQLMHNKFMNQLQENTSMASSLGTYFLSQNFLIFLDVLIVYRLKLYLKDI
ncbi:uncharacterized protein LOC133824558 isoform X6 [Humulus lupulus]|uniref:uncharacterized protein LOC133824558 isoform X6 n=1 Tax=Humulus lupulus TaxID=3486 RepID=UPI002B417C6C|nr:uncharacterized protein LOC133824558 isoform X6 [Humulus lupulus]XP_062113462.1 uncharacterized protein LOC133824558 isoform X6 [Humulus lupulus]